MHSRRKPDAGPQPMQKLMQIIDIIVMDSDDSFGRMLMDVSTCLLSLLYFAAVGHNGIFEHCRDAEKYFEDHPDISAYINIYEDGQKDPLKAVQDLSDFLGLPPDDNLCQAIAEKCEFSKMKVDKEDYSLKVEGKSFIFRKGTSGEWRDWFTEELLDEYYKVYEEKMAGSRFYHRYSRSATT